MSERGERSVKVLFIGGFLRIGSTLLDRILGQIEGFFSVGELRYVWEESFAQDQPCGCGRHFGECPFWKGVVGRAYGGFSGLDLEATIRLKRRVDRVRYVPQLAHEGARTPTFRRDLEEYARVLGGLYGAIREESGARVIVDSSKDASHAYVLRNVPGVELYVLHLVRDSRAVAYSWMRKKVKHVAKGEKVYMDQYSATRSAVGWARANLLVEPFRLRAGRYTAARYEDLMADPQGTVGGIVDFVGEGGVEAPFEGRAIELRPNHTVAGNPMRFRQGRIELRSDDEWRRKLAPEDRRVVTALTSPLLLRYGYLGPDAGGS